MALLTPAELSKDELGRLYAEEKLLESLKWEVSPGKTRAQTKVWTSRQTRIYPQRRDQYMGYYAESLTLRKKLNPDESLPAHLAMESQYGGYHTVCMSYEDTWYGCSCEFQCKGQTPKDPGKKMLFIEYGATKKSVIQRIVERSESPLYSAMECSLVMSTMNCKQQSF